MTVEDILDEMQRRQLRAFDWPKLMEAARKSARALDQIVYSSDSSQQREIA